jgi:outer membrane biosynthesis protein TonB
VLAQLPAESATATVFDPLPHIPRADSMTTLGTSVGESTAGSGQRKLGMWIAVSAVAVAAGVVLAVMTTRPSGRDDAAIVPATTTIVPAPQPEIEEPKPEPRPEPKPAPEVEEPATASTPAVEPPPPSDPPARTPTTRPPPTRKVAPKKPKPPAGNLYDDRI